MKSSSSSTRLLFFCEDLEEELDEKLVEELELKTADEEEDTEEEVTCVILQKLPTSAEVKRVPTVASCPSNVQRLLPVKDPSPDAGSALATRGQFVELHFSRPPPVVSIASNH